jgi:hypothetical protein
MVVKKGWNQKGNDKTFLSEAKVIKKMATGHDTE